MIIYEVENFGGCRICELVAMSVGDVEDKGGVLIVQIPVTKTHKPRTFTIINGITLFLLLMFFGSTEYYSLKRLHTNDCSSVARTKNTRYNL